MSKTKRMLLAALSCILILSLSVFGTALYLTDSDTATNTVTIGDVKIDLLEPSWEDTDYVEPNQELPKNPQIKNTGINDAIVYMTVEVPVDNITLTADNGTKGTKARSELFWFKDTSDSPSTHANNFDSNWVHLDTKDTGSDLTGTSRTYVFAYKTPLAKDATTTPLFDKIQVKNFIENEIAVGMSEDIHINAYSIQASDVLENGVDLTDNLTTANLAKIYDTYINQSGDIKLYYYTTLNLAASDANALTTANADLPTKDGAACALHIKGNTARLELLKDISNQTDVTFTENVEFNLGGNEIAFANNKRINANKSFVMMNGSLKSNLGQVIKADASSELFSLSNVDITTKITDSSLMFVPVSSRAQDNIIRNVNVDVTANTSQSTAIIGVVSSAHAEIDSCAINVSGTHSHSLRGIMLAYVPDGVVSNTTINMDVSASQNNSENVYPNGISIYPNTKAVIRDSNIIINANTKGETAAPAGISSAGEMELLRTDITVSNQNYSICGVNLDVPSRSIIKDSNIVVIGEGTISNCGVFGVYNKGNAEITDTSITASVENGVARVPVACIDLEASSVTKINGGELFNHCTAPNSEGDSYGTGVAVLGSAKLTVGDLKDDTVISGGNNAISVNGAASVDVYSGLFKATNHGGMYVASTGNVNIYGGTFHCITEPNDPNYSSAVSHFGGLYVYSDAGNVNINNATITGGKHGLRIKSNNSGTSAHVTIDNSSVSGQVNAFSIDNGTLEIGSGVTTNYTVRDIAHNGGTVIDHRND